MKRLYKLCIVTVCLVANVFLVACDNNTSDMVAKVGSEVISKEDLNDRISSFPAESQSFFQVRENQVRLLDQLIDEESLYQYARHQGLHKLETTKKQISEIKEQIKRQENLLLRRAVIAAFIEQEIDSQVEINEEDVKAYFDNNQALYGKVEQRKLSHILVKTEAEANTVLKKLKKGSSFSELAAQNSIDGTKDKGGDLGWVTADVLVDEFSNVAFALKKKGAVSGVVESPFGFHIIKYHSKKDRPALKFDDVKNDIYQELYTAKREDRFQTILKKAKEQIKVTRDISKIGNS